LEKTQAAKIKGVTGRYQRKPHMPVKTKEDPEKIDQERSLVIGLPLAIAAIAVTRVESELHLGYGR
jgi:hypothetical protein